MTSTVNEDNNRTYSVQQLMSYRRQECAETKAYFNQIKFFKNPRNPKQQRKRGSQQVQTNKKKITYSNEFLYTFQHARHCQKAPNRAKFPNYALKRDPKRKQPSTNKTFGDEATMEDPEFPIAYPGREMLENAGIDTTGKTNEELFELEKQFIRNGLTKDSSDSAPNSPSLQPEIQLDSDSDTDNELAGDIDLILTSDDLFPKAKKDSFRLDEKTSIRDPTWSLNLFGDKGDHKASPVQTLNRTQSHSASHLSFSPEMSILSPPRRTSILAALQLDQPEPEPEPEPEEIPVADEETINKGTEIGTMLLDMFNQEMKTNPTRVSGNSLQQAMQTMPQMQNMQNMPPSGHMQHNSMPGQFRGNHPMNQPRNMQMNPQHLNHVNHGPQHAQQMGNHFAQPGSFRGFPQQNPMQNGYPNMGQQYPPNMRPPVNSNPQMQGNMRAPPQGYGRPPMGNMQNGYPNMPPQYRMAPSQMQQQQQQQQQYFNVPPQNTRYQNFPQGQYNMNTHQNSVPHVPHSIPMNQPQSRIEIDKIFAQT